MTLEHSDYGGGSYQAHFRVCNSEMQIGDGRNHGKSRFLFYAVGGDPLRSRAYTKIAFQNCNNSLETF